MSQLALYERNRIALRSLWLEQVPGIEGVYQAVREGHRRIVLYAPTGWGKTQVAAYLIARSIDKGRRPLFTCPGITLVDQTLRKFEAEGIYDIGVIQADHERTNPDAQLQIACVPTLIRRTIDLPDFVIVDECHLQSIAFNKWLDAHPDIIAVGLSATPWTKGLGHRWTKMVVGARIQQLIDAGRLCDFRIYAPAHGLDRGSVKTERGEFVEESASKAMSKATIVGDVVKEWFERGPGEKTFLFCVNRAHAKAQMGAFIDSGFPFGYIDGETSREDRKREFQKMAHGEIAGIASVGCLDEETEILTSDGWAGIDDIAVSHRVASWWNGFVEFTNPLSIIRGKRKDEERMVSVDGVHANIRVTDDHRMLWSSTRGGKFDFRLAKECANRRGFIPVTGNAEPARFLILQDHPEKTPEKTRSRKHNQIYAYMKRGKKKGEAKELANDYRERISSNCSLVAPDEVWLDECRLIGFWLGDGGRTSGRVTLSQSVTNAGVVRWVDTLLAKLQIDYRRDVDPPSEKRKADTINWDIPWGRCGGTQRREGVSRIDDYLDKNGSSLYWGFNKDQLMALLEGFRMADGNHGKNGNGAGRGKRIFGASKPIFDLLQAICSVRGIWATISSKMCRNTLMHVFSYRIADSHEITRERLQFEDPKSERIWCVECTTGAIIVRRRGKVCVVGNCLIAGVDEDVRCICDCAPTLSEMRLQQKWGRGLRTAPGKEFLVGLDHANNNGETGLGLFSEIFHDHLDASTPKQKGAYEDEKKPAKPRVCKHCAAIVTASASVCPACGMPMGKGKGVREQQGELALIDRGKPAKEPKASRDDKQVWFSAFLGIAEERGHSQGWAAHRYKEKFGVWPRNLEKRAIPPTRAALDFDYQRRRMWKQALQPQEEAYTMESSKQ